MLVQISLGANKCIIVCQWSQWRISGIQRVIIQCLYSAYTKMGSGMGHSDTLGCSQSLIFSSAYDTYNCHF